MGQGLKDLLDSEVGCDIAFQVGDETYKAHKLILAARSPVFRAQFFGPVGNNNVDRIVIEDIEPSIFKVIFVQFYIGNVVGCTCNYNSADSGILKFCRLCLASSTPMYFLMCMKLLGQLLPVRSQT